MEMVKRSISGHVNFSEYHNHSYHNSNNNDPLSALDWKPFDEAAAFISFILFTIIVVLNGFVIFLLRFKVHQKRRLFYFVLNLAIADLLVGVLNVFGDGIQSAMNGEWHGGDVLCRLWRFSKILVLIASNNILIGMSLDRFLAIKYPLNTVRIGIWRHINKTLVFSAWIISLIVASFVLKYSEGINAVPDADAFMDQKGVCDLTFPDEWWKTYMTIVAAGVYIIPTFVIAVCYVGICIVIWKKWRAGLKLSEISASEHRVCDSNKTGLLPKANIKSVKMTAVICSAFFVCWTPYFIVMILDVFEYALVDERYLMVVGMLYPLNSACNPLIFIMFNLKLFRRQQQENANGTSYALVTNRPIPVMPSPDLRSSV